MAQELTAARVRTLNVFTRPELNLIQRTVAKDCNDLEFDTFITIAAGFNLNPLKRQIYAFVFNKGTPEKPDPKRNMVIVTGIGGYRTIAERARNEKGEETYMADDEKPAYVYKDELKNEASNPLGLYSCTARVKKWRNGAWHIIPHEVFWDAYAPLIKGGKKVPSGETWPDGNPKMIFEPDGTAILDPGKPRWRTDGHGMLAKCAEAGAFRKGWPDDFSGLYGEEELDQMRSRFSQDLELSPSEYAESQRVDDRLQLIQGKDTVLMLFPPGDLAPIRIGQIFDAAMAYFKEQGNDPDAIEYWRDQNKHGLQEYWGRAAGDCLALKKAMEKLIADGREAAKAAKAAADKELQNQTNEGGQNDSL